MVLGKIGNNGLLYVPEPLFSFTLKILPDRASQAVFNYMVSIQKR
jgi:hypothetical protein